MSSADVNRRQVLNALGIVAPLTLFSSSIQAKAEENGNCCSEIRVVDCIFSLLDPNLAICASTVLVKGYHHSGDGGGGIFIYEPTLDVSKHNGGTIVSPKFKRPNWNKEEELKMWFGLIQSETQGKGAWRRIDDRDLNILYFGAKRDGSDDSIAIQSALNEKKPIFFPKGTYTVFKTLHTDGFIINGESASRSSIIEYNGDDYLFKTTGYYEDIDSQWIVAMNITFKGQYVHHTESKQSGINFSRSNNRGDIDAKFYNCEFTNFYKALHIIGRGLDVNECYFVGCKYGVYLDRLENEIEWYGDSEKIETGGRVYVIRDSRFHSMGGGGCVVNISSDNPHRQFVRGIHFVGNYIDTDASIFLGSCSESIFSSNSHLYGPGREGNALFKIDGKFFNNTVSSNNFSAMNRRVYSNIFFFNEDSFCKGLNFSSNNVDNINDFVILSKGKMYDSLISNNVFTDVALNKDIKEASLMFFNEDTGRVLINSNIFSLSTSSRFIDSISNNDKPLISGNVYNFTSR
ncbi:glycosyl hydrolase family 28-related protein [Vibrio fluvialis]|uniref:glycosyl hydrolase family 28-related protein n=2 Tax=Vibrio fluvialis TaxID=676 RepID=UPI001302C895|nr:glycosyl hydrolase family 28-related protein [Vibrio fluvialis]EKO3514584.1 hypothetical protein [Vibrio fluvialis]MCE7608038.1 glycoside hydrolase family 55 protein [Vibrio fluvialis]UPO64899.1 hypothetical protein [Vibrio fluvialis]